MCGHAIKEIGEEFEGAFRSGFQMFGTKKYGDRMPPPGETQEEANERIRKSSERSQIRRRQRGIAASGHQRNIFGGGAGLKTRVGE